MATMVSCATVQRTLVHHPRAMLIAVRRRVPGVLVMILGSAASPLRAGVLPARAVAGSTSSSPTASLAGEIQCAPVMEAVQEHCGKNPSRYEALAKKVEAAVQKALEKTTWNAPDGTSRSFAEHPVVRYWGRLSAAAREQFQKPARNAPATQQLLSEFPWPGRLELATGMQYGSTDTSPPEGIVNHWLPLGEPRQPRERLRSYPANTYWYGTAEILSSRYGVEPARLRSVQQAGLEKREPRDRPQLEEKLPPWETLRALVSGTLPEVHLFVVPELTHLLHARLRERRTQDGGGKISDLDRRMAFLDSRRQGFYFKDAYTGQDQVLVYSTFTLIGEPGGFLSGFWGAAKLGNRYLPYVSDPLFRDYAAAFLGVTLDVPDFFDWKRTPEAAQAIDAFYPDRDYLLEYKQLLDFLAWSALPLEPGPTHLERQSAGARAFGDPRALTLLAWAAVDQDPARLADLLHEHVFAAPGHRFPGSKDLLPQFLGWARDHASELLEAVQLRVTRERESGSLAGTPAALLEGVELPGDFAVQFLNSSNEALVSNPGLQEVRASAERCHREISGLIQRAAVEALGAELHRDFQTE